MAALSQVHALPDLLDWIDSPLGAPGSPAAFRIDDFIEGDRYVLRADIPGVDAERDIDVEVTDDLLTVRAHRREEEAEEEVAKRHKEVRYGDFSRTVRLPAGSRTDDVSARYDAGVLEVTVPVAAVPAARKVRVAVPHRKER